MNEFNDPIHVLEGPINPWSVISHVAASVGEEIPFFLCDVDDIIKKFEMWKAVMPRVMPHYAMKCNDHPTVLKVLAALGLGFDCATKKEIDKVLSLGVHPDRIIFAHTTKIPNHIRHAAKRNVRLMTFDNELELHKIKNLFPNARAVIRIKYDAKKSQCPFGLKFGCDPNTEAPQLLRLASILDINVVGVSFHVGSGCGDPSAFHGAIAASRYVFDVATTLGYNFSLLDIGGGYPGEMNDSINDYAEIINPALEEYFHDTSVRIISEPGTYFVRSAFRLACNVHSSRKAVTQDPTTGVSKTMYHYYLNDGVFGSLSCIISYHMTKIPQPLKKYPGSKKHLSIVWGPTCDTVDEIIRDFLLPELQLGDWLVFTDMGAYTLTLYTPFNSFDPASVHSVISRNNWLLLRNKPPFTAESFINECDNNLLKIDLQIVKERHCEFPESSFVRG